jgi:hypothetical protein
MNELKELREMILGLDELVGYWFEGYNANLLSAGGDNVYSQADHYRNRALEIIKNLEDRG